MVLVYTFSIVIFIILSCVLFNAIVKYDGIAEFIINSYISTTGIIVIAGLILSYNNSITNIMLWLLVLFLYTSTLLLVKKIYIKNEYQKDEIISIFNKLTISKYDMVLIFPLASAFVITFILSLSIVFFTAPNNWDSMTCHMARVAYYIQHNNFNHFEANYWAQVVHQKIAPILMSFTYLVSDRSENATQLVQFISYVVAICAVFGIARRIGYGLMASAFSALVFSLLTICLMESTTTQNDMIMTAYIGATIYYLLSFKKYEKTKNLLLAGISLGLSIGTKSSIVLILPSVIVVLIYSMIKDKKIRIRNLIIFSVSLIVAVLIFAIPTGYLENYRNYGNPLGPVEVRKEHSFEGWKTSVIVKEGAKNVFKFSYDFLLRDGIPNIMPWKMSQGKIYVWKSNEDVSYWGPMGIGLIWIAVFYHLFKRDKYLPATILSLATVIFLIIQSVGAPYDYFRGRYFMISAVFATPVVGQFYEMAIRNKILKYYLLILVYLGSLSALTAILLRPGKSILSYADNMAIYKYDRIGQLTKNNSSLYEIFKKYEEIVPKNATVALYLKENNYEYPYFGEKLTRNIMPVTNEIQKALREKRTINIPMIFEYLVYQKEIMDIQPGDVLLGEGIYLRKID